MIVLLTIAICVAAVCMVLVPLRARKRRRYLRDNERLSGRWSVMQDSEKSDTPATMVFGPGCAGYTERGDELETFAYAVRGNRLTLSSCGKDTHYSLHTRNSDEVELRPYRRHQSVEGQAGMRLHRFADW